MDNREAIAHVSSSGKKNLSLFGERQDLALAIIQREGSGLYCPDILRRRKSWKQN
jgi:hypothetical protein